MKYKKIIIIIILSGIILFPMFMWLGWVFRSKKPLKILIVDKTVITKEAIEHRAFIWLLTHNKYVKENREFYSASEDYFGAFPQENNKYKIKDLRVFSEKQIDSLSNYYQMLYYADTYGIHPGDGLNEDQKGADKIYSGLDENDFLLLKKMKEKKKLIIAEFNFFANPTTESVRKKTEDLFHLKWTGWTGRFFSSLDSTGNSELPDWVIKLYVARHHKKWNFLNSGIVLVNQDGDIAVLENETHLNTNMPVVSTDEYGRDKYDLPSKINYSYWFDITLSTDPTNKVISSYTLDVNARGDSVLKHHGIPKTFPAVIEHLDNYKFYYFCGDFGDAPVSNRFVNFKGIRCFEKMFLSDRNRLKFYWRFYYPMLKNILDEYYKTIKN